MRKLDRQWQHLCISAAIEENPQRLMEICAQLHRGLPERQAELSRKLFKTKQLTSVEEMPVGPWVQ